MNFFPTNGRDRWLLLLFPFKAYVIAAPVCFLVWEVEASEQWVRGAREEAMGPIVLAYEACLVAFLIAGVLGCFLRNIKLAAGSLLFAVCALLFPAMIYNHASLLLIPGSVFAWGLKFISDRHLPRLAVQKNENSIECPE